VTVRRKEFLLITFLLPIGYLLMIGVIGAINASAMGSVRKSQQPAINTVGFVDESGLLDRATLEKARGGVAGKIFATVGEGQKAVERKQIRSLIAVPADFAKSGAVRVYMPESKNSLFSGGDRPGGGQYVPLLRRALLTGKADAVTVEAATREVSVERLQFNPDTGKFEAPDPFRLAGKFIVPYAFSLVLLMSVIFSASYLVHGIVEEKENRVIEVLLSAASHGELLAGKVIGLGGAGLLQLVIWISGASLTVGFAAMRLPQVSAFAASPGMIATAFCMFLLGFALYASLMAGFGSMGTSWRESQQITGGVVLPLVVPLMVLPVLLEAPDGGVARFLSLFPFTAPIAMMLRIAAGGGSLWEVLLSTVLLAFTTVGVLWMAARLFRLSLLMYGQRPGPAQIFRHLFAR
jgi:ABC-2 type transport system permease protein